MEVCGDDVRRSQVGDDNFSQQTLEHLQELQRALNSTTVTWAMMRRMDI